MMRYIQHVCLCFLLVKTIAQEGRTNHVYNFLAMLNGNYSNPTRLQSGPSSQGVFIRNIPVDVIALRPHTALFFEESLNGKTLRLRLSVGRETSPGIIKLTNYNVTKPGYYEKPPGTITISEISSFTGEDIYQFHDCSAVFQAVGNDSFYGKWENCDQKVNGVRAYYTMEINCDDLFVSVPLNAPEKSSVMPHRLVRHGPRYQVPGTPPDFSSACDKKN